MPRARTVNTNQGKIFKAKGVADICETGYNCIVLKNIITANTIYATLGVHSYHVQLYVHGQA